MDSYEFMRHVKRCSFAKRNAYGQAMCDATLGGCYEEDCPCWTKVHPKQTSNKSPDSPRLTTAPNERATQ